jgi:hypothetical protein
VCKGEKSWHAAGYEAGEVAEESGNIRGRLRAGKCALLILHPLISTFSFSTYHYVFRAELDILFHWLHEPLKRTQFCVYFSILWCSTSPRHSE